MIELSPDRSAAMSYTVCRFATGLDGCHCGERRLRPCLAAESVAHRLFNEALEHIQATHSLRKKAQP